jgi:hypothetical protein
MLDAVNDREQRDISRTRASHTGDFYMPRFAVGRASLRAYLFVVVHLNMGIQGAGSIDLCLLRSLSI